MENTVIVSDPSSSHYLPGPSKPHDARTSADAQESMKAKVIAIRKKLVEQVRAAGQSFEGGGAASGQLRGSRGRP